MTICKWWLDVPNKVNVGTETLCDASENKVLWEKQQSFHIATNNKKCCTFKLSLTMNMNMHQQCNKCYVNINIFEIFGRAVSIMPRFSLLLSLIIYKASASRNMSRNLMWDATFCFHLPHAGIVNVGNVNKDPIGTFWSKLVIVFQGTGTRIRTKRVQTSDGIATWVASNESKWEW